MKGLKNPLENVNVNEIETALARCWQWFFSYPQAKMGLTDLAASIKSSKTSTKLAVEYLINQQFLTRDIIGKA